MIRNLKALGLALVAVFAMSAVAASGASATAGEVSWGANTTWITAETDPSAKDQTFTVTPGSITASFTCDELSGKAMVDVEKSSATSITGEGIAYNDSGTTPEKEVCTGKVNGIALKTTVKFNECDYHLNAGTTVGEKAAGISEGSAEIKCPAGKVIEVNAAGCLVKVGPQKVGRLTYTTVKTGTKEEITAHAEVGETAGAENNAIDYTTSGITCGTKSETDGTYKGTVTFKGSDVNGNQTDVTIT
jgi:hypothetical protein